MHTKLTIQDDQRGGDGIENRLRVLAFVNGLLNTGPKRGDIRECEDRPRRLPADCRIGSRAKQEAPIAAPEVTTAWRIIRDDLPTELLNIPDVPQSGDGIERPPYVGRRERECLRRRPIDASQRAVPSDDHDGHIDGVEHRDDFVAARIGRGQVARIFLGVPTRIGSRHHQAQSILAR